MPSRTRSDTSKSQSQSVREDSPKKNKSSQRPTKNGKNSQDKKEELDDDVEKMDDQSSQEDLTEDIRTHKIDDCIRYLLTAHQNQKPVTRTELVHNCFETNKHRKLFNEVFEEAKRKLRGLFGIELVEAADRKGYYYLSNSLRHMDFLETTNDQSAIDALLYAILSNIFMKDPQLKVIDEKNFKAFLSKLGVELIVDHSIFGDVKKLIEKTFVEQGWLAISRQSADHAVDASTMLDLYYGWGWRSLLVLGRGDALEFVSNIVYPEGRRESEWTEHQEVAENEDKDEPEILPVATRRGGNSQERMER